MFRLA